MTREEAIKNIKEHCYMASLIPQGKEALDMAIKSLEQEPCEDAVSRQAVVELVEGWWLGHTKEDDLATEVKALPSVTPTTCIAKVTFDKDELKKIVDEKVKEMVVERKKGKWIEEPNCWLRCSCCKSHYPHTSINGVNGSNYCPNCGAEMESE